MNEPIRCARFAPAFTAALLLTAAACSNEGPDKINGSVHVAAGGPAAAASTVNGGITIDDGAAVTSASTVNGSVKLGARASADSLQTVNGSVTLGAGAHVAKDVESVNGAITLAEGADVGGAVGNVNGRITLTAAHVAGGIHTVKGGIVIRGASHVEGGIQIDLTHGVDVHFGRDEVPRVEIGPGATVQGELKFAREVKLYVSERATIGLVTGATAISFAGDSPPAD